MDSQLGRSVMSFIRELGKADKAKHTDSDKLNLQQTVQFSSDIWLYLIPLVSVKHSICIK